MPIDPPGSRRRRKHAPYDHGEPIGWISMVPLAGILAIAGALVASSYELPTHSVTVDLPFYENPDELGPLTPNADRLVITADGELLWNAVAVSERELVTILRDPRYKASGAALLFTPDARVPYGRAVGVLEILRREDAIGRCFRFSGIARYRHYDRPESFEDLLPHAREDCPPLPPRETMPTIVR